jgi:hypothetical protein
VLRVPINRNGIRRTTTASDSRSAWRSRATGTLYVAAFGSSKSRRVRHGSLENNTFVPTSDDHIAVTGGGPTAVVLDEAAHSSTC